MVFFLSSATSSGVPGDGNESPREHEKEMSIVYIVMFTPSPSPRSTTNRTRRSVGSEWSVTVLSSASATSGTGSPVTSSVCGRRSVTPRWPRTPTACRLFWRSGPAASASTETLSACGHLQVRDGRWEMGDGRRETGGGK